MCFSSEKVSKKCFNFEAIAGYDQAVRDRVGLLGYVEFSNIEIHVLYRLGMMEHKSHLFILSTTFCIYIYVVKSHEILMGFLHVIPCILRGNLCRVRNENLPSYISYTMFNFPSVADISPNVTDFPTVVTVALLRTHSLQSLFAMGYNKLKSFHIQSCCMMSMYHITECNPSIKNIFKIL